MITDTHDNNICAQKLNRNRTFFNHCTFSWTLAFKVLNIECYYLVTVDVVRGRFSTINNGCRETCKCIWSAIKGYFNTTVDTHLSFSSLLIVFGLACFPADAGRLLSTGDLVVSCTRARLAAVLAVNRFILGDLGLVGEFKRFPPRPPSAIPSMLSNR